MRDRLTNLIYKSLYKDSVRKYKNKHREKVLANKQKDKDKDKKRRKDIYE